MAKQKLGQHFLFDKNILRKIVTAMEIGKNDAVIEIGAGRGTLTDELAVNAGRVYAVEIDNWLCEFLRERFALIPSVTIVEGDILEIDLEHFGAAVALGNIPYYITTPIIFRLLETRSIARFGLLMQKEVADRIVALEGSGDYGILSINVQFQSDARIAFIVKKSSFSPPPKVDSAFVIFEKLPVDERLRDKLRELVRASFSMRRKTLYNNLKDHIPDVDGFFSTMGLDKKIRPEKVPAETYYAMAGILLKGKR